MFVGSAGEGRAQDQMHLDSWQESAHAVKLSFQFPIFGGVLTENTRKKPFWTKKETKSPHSIFQYMFVRYIWRAQKKAHKKVFCFSVAEPCLVYSS